VTWKWFIVSAVLAAAVLIPLGAPMTAIVTGIVIAGALTWRKQYRR
jgi:hypothetical protein